MVDAIMASAPIHLASKLLTQSTFPKSWRKWNSFLVLCNPYPYFFSMAFRPWLENRLLWFDRSIIYMEIRAKFKRLHCWTAVSLYSMVIILWDFSWKVNTCLEQKRRHFGKWICELFNYLHFIFWPW